MKTRIIIICCCIALCVGSVLLVPKDRLLDERIQLIQQLTHSLRQVKDATSAQRSIPDLVGFIKANYSLDEFFLFYSFLFRGVTGYQVNDSYQFISRPPHEDSPELESAINDYYIECTRIRPLLEQFQNQEFAYLCTSLAIYLYPPHERSSGYSLY